MPEIITQTNGPKVDNNMSDTVFDKITSRDSEIKTHDSSFGDTVPDKSDDNLKGLASVTTSNSTAPPSVASSVQGSPEDHAVTTTNGTANANSVQTQNGAASNDKSPKNAPKLPACADCKRLKVKCVRSDPDNYVSDCLRCIKKKLPCVTGLNAKKTSHDDRYGSHSFERKSRIARKFDGLKEVQMSSILMRDQLMHSWKLLTTRDDRRLQLLERYDYTSLAKPSNNVLKRGSLTHEQVVRRIKIYREELYPKWSVVGCAPPDDLEQFMTDYPVLFHTILDVASQLIQDEKENETSVISHNMVLRTVIDEIMVVSVKSVELLKCLILLTQWYNESELYHQQRLHVLTASAVSVSYDSGLGGATITTAGSNAPPFEQMVTPQGASDCHSVESYTLWVAVYTALFQSSMANRRPIKSHWNKYTELAVSVLRDLSLNQRAHDEANYRNQNGYIDRPENCMNGPGLISGGDFDLWELAKLRHLQETIVLTVFKQQNETVAIDLNTTAGQYTVHQSSMAIDELEKSFPVLSLRRRMAIASTRTLLHQAVLYAKYDESLGRAPFTNFSLNPQSGPLSFQAAQSFRECVRNALLYLDAIVTRDPRDIVAEICNIWTSVTLCCDVSSKCRACAIFNRYYAEAYFVTEEEINRIYLIVEKFDTIVRDYPNCNNAVSFGFFIKLLLCHHDARSHHHSTRLHPDLFGDPQFVRKSASSAQGASEKLTKRPHENTELFDQAYGMAAKPSQAMTPNMNYSQPQNMGQGKLISPRPPKLQRFENSPNFEEENMRNNIMNASNAKSLARSSEQDVNRSLNQTMGPNMDSNVDSNMDANLGTPRLNQVLSSNKNLINRGIPSENMENGNSNMELSIDGSMGPNSVGLGIMPGSGQPNNVSLMNGNDSPSMKDYSDAYTNTQVQQNVDSLSSESQPANTMLMNNDAIGNSSMNFPDNNKPYSPVSIDQQAQPGDMQPIGPSPNENYAWNEASGLDAGPVEFDSQALNYIESFWGDFATQLGDGSQSTFYFPV